MATTVTATSLDGYILQLCTATGRVLGWTPIPDDDLPMPTKAGRRLHVEVPIHTPGCGTCITLRDADYEALITGAVIIDQPNVAAGDLVRLDLNITL